MNAETRAYILRERDAAVRRSLQVEKEERRRLNRTRAHATPQTDGRKVRISILQPS